ncbi:ABC transporter ATP-binding protein [Nocardioides sp. L-11A]|uniref:ABC transporter ATP-binding protein n=1 Tax=Nocardioides sp. L-11A TaxID=3043848 RepID=UPI00249A4B7E|nr:ABC transporter ATP-binding protein [Nocardioides sp. L-11A]
MTAPSQRVALAGVSVDYGKGPVVTDLDLTVAPGEITALLGQSGCGKSTTLRAIAGLVTPTAGTIHFGDDDVTFTPPWRRELGLVFQNHALFPHLSVARNVEYGLRRRMSRPERRRRVAEMLALVGLEEFAESEPAQLSGGQSQRAALARALAPAPRILLLDEPFSALDANLRDRMRAEVESIIRKVGVTTVMVTHDQDEAMSMADRVAIMAEGRILEVAAPEDIFRRPAFAYTARFVGASNLLAGQIEGTGGATRFRVGETALALAVPATAVPAAHALAIKPEDVLLDPAAGTDVVLDAELAGSKFHGAVRDLTWTVPVLGGAVVRSRVPAGSVVPDVGGRGRIGWRSDRAALVHDPDRGAA